MKHELIKLPYSYDALEPYIDAETMEIHHTKHHQAYADKMNAVLEKYPDLAGKPVEELLKGLNNLNMAETDKTTFRNNGGGYVNHNLYWEIMSPNAGGEPSGNIRDVINDSFGSFSKFKEELTNAAMTIFGSGWAWLVVKDNKLEVVKTSNQDSPLTEGKTAILGLDVWEHAYYKKFGPNRGGYISSWWNVVNWRQIGENYQNAMEK